MNKGAQDRRLACRPMLRRVYTLARALRNKGEIPTAKIIGAKTEYSYKTIYRDIEMLRDFWGYPVAYDKTEHRWKVRGQLPEPVL